MRVSIELEHLETLVLLAEEMCQYRPHYEALRAAKKAIRDDVAVAAEPRR